MSVYSRRDYLYGLGLKVTLCGHREMHSNLQFLLRVENTEGIGDGKTFSFDLIHSMERDNEFYVFAQLPDCFVDPNGYILFSIANRSNEILFYGTVKHKTIKVCRHTLATGSKHADVIQLKSINGGQATIEIDKMGCRVGTNEIQRSIHRMNNNLYLNFGYWAKMYCTDTLPLNMGLHSPMSPISAFALTERINRKSFEYHGFLSSTQSFCTTWEADWNVSLNIVNRIELPLSMYARWDLLLDLVTANISAGECTGPTISYTMSVPRNKTGCALNKLVACLLVYKALYTGSRTPLDHKNFFLQSRTKRKLLCFLYSCWPCLAVSGDGTISFGMLKRESLESLQHSSEVFDVGCIAESFPSMSDICFLIWQDFKSENVICCLVGERNKEHAPAFQLSYTELLCLTWNHVCMNEPEIFRPLLHHDSADSLPSRLSRLGHGCEGETSKSVKWQTGWIYFPASIWEKRHGILQLECPRYLNASYCSDSV